MIRCESPNSCQRYPELPRFRVGTFEMTLVAARGFDDALEHHQMRGVRFVQAR